MSVFARREFLQSVSDEYGWLGGLDAAGVVRCVLPYTIIRKSGVRLVRFRVETAACGPSLDVHEERIFLNAVVEHFRAKRADVIIPASTNTIFRTYPDRSVAAPYGTYIIDLSKEEGVLWANLSANHRRQVRSAEKVGVRLRHAPERLASCHTIIRDTFRKSSLPFMSVEAFASMVRGLAGNANLFVAERDGLVQSCALIGFSQYSAYYMYGGSIPEATTGSMHLLHWEAIRLYRQLGVRRYDFCGARIAPPPGSKAAGLAAFKERFGAELHRGYMWKCAISSFKSAVYSLAVKCLRGGDIVDVERHKLHDRLTGDSSQL